MTTPRRAGRTSPNATQPSRMAGLRLPDGVSPGQHAFNTAVKQILETGIGGRGVPYDQWVTRRDLHDMGIDTGLRLQQPGTAGQPKGNPGTIPVVGSGGTTYMGFEDFAQRIYGSYAFQVLARGVRDLHRFDAYPTEIRNVLLKDIAAEAAKRGADIRRIENKIQTDTQSLAYSVEELTASTANSFAGVRQTMFAYADGSRAMAGVVTQVQARLDDFNSTGASVEEAMTAIADRTAGLAAEWHVTVTAGNKVAGIALAASEDPSGVSESAFLILADRFAIVAASDVIADPSAPPSNRIPFGVDTTTNTIFMNGSVRINAGGTSLNEVGKFITIYAPAQTFKQGATGTWDRSSITLTTTKYGGLTGAVTWSITNGTYGGSLTDSGGSLTINRTDMTSDTITVRASVTDGTTFTDDMTIVKLVDGRNTITGFLTNEAITLSAAADGTVSSFTPATGTFKVYEGITDKTTSAVFALASSSGMTASINAGTGVYSVSALSADTGAADFTATYNGVTITKTLTVAKSKTGAGAPLLVLTPTAQAFTYGQDGTASPASQTISFTAQLTNLSGTATFACTLYDSSNSIISSAALGGSGNTRTLSVANFSNAAYAVVTASLSSYSDQVTVVRLKNGSNATVGYLTNESVSLAADSSGNVISFSTAAGNFKVFNGTTDVTSLSTFATVTQSSVTASINSSGAYSISAMSASNGYAEFTATYNGVTITKRCSVSKSVAGASGSTGSTGATGTRGSRHSYIVSGSYSGATSLATLRAAATSQIASDTAGSTPTTPIKGDEVTFSNGTNWAYTLVNDGTYGTNGNSSWNAPGVVIDGSLLVTGSVTAGALAVGTITAASGVIADLTITNAKIVNLTIDNDKVAAGAMSGGYSGSSSSGSLTISSIAVPSNAQCALIVVGAGQLYAPATGGESGDPEIYRAPSCSISINGGGAVATSYGSVVYVVPSPAAGTYSVTATREAITSPFTSYVGNLTAAVLIMKR